MVGEVILSAVIKAITSKPKVTFGFLLSAVVLLAMYFFLPPGITMKLGLNDIINKYRGWIVLAAIVLGCISLIYFVVERSRRKAILSSLDRLSHEEREYLLFCIYKNQQTLISLASDGIAHALVQKGILEMKEGVVNIQKTPYMIPDFIWKHLNLNKNKQKYFPELFDAEVLKNLEKKYE